MPTPLTADTIATAPKVLLHDHLDGGLRPATLSTWPTRSATTACPTTDVADLARWFSESAYSGSLERYLETFTHTTAVMQTRESLIRVASECVQDLAADGVVYAEIRFAPELHTERNLTLTEVVQAVLDGVAAGTRAAAPSRAPDPGAVAADRDAARRAVAGRSPSCASLSAIDEVAGFDIAGAEAGFPPTRHLDAFEYLRRENAHFTIHAGEAFGLPSIWEALQWCGADRLGHGVRIVDDIAVDRRTASPTLGRLAAYVRDKRIPLEMAPTSNVQTGAADVDRRTPDRPARPT